MFCFVFFIDISFIIYKKFQINSMLMNLLIFSKFFRGKVIKNQLEKLEAAKGA